MKKKGKRKRGRKFPLNSSGHHIEQLFTKSIHTVIDDVDLSILAWRAIVYYYHSRDNWMTYYCLRMH